MCKFLNFYAEKSGILVRLTPNEDNVDFLGRIEVMYNGTWGTVCENRFSRMDGHVFCKALGYEEAICVPLYSTLVREAPGEYSHSYL